MVPVDAYVFLRREWFSIFQLRISSEVWADCTWIHCYTVSVYEFGAVCTGAAGLGLRALLKSRTWIPCYKSSGEPLFFPLKNSRTHFHLENYAPTSTEGSL
jgi:hypothetical protein